MSMNQCVKFSKDCINKAGKSGQAFTEQDINHIEVEASKQFDSLSKHAMASVSNSFWCDSGPAQMSYLTDIAGCFYSLSIPHRKEEKGDGRNHELYEASAPRCSSFYGAAKTRE